MQPDPANVAFDDVLSLAAGEPDAHIVYGPNENQFGELWRPRVDRGRPPLIIMIHGGCWQAAFNVRHTRPLCEAMATRGFAVWSIEYRRLGQPGAGWPGTFDDVAAAIDHVGDLDVTYSKVILVGHSAGGHLALWASTRPQLGPDAHFYRERPLAIDHTLSLAGIVDLERFASGESACERSAAELVGAPPPGYPERYAQVSPRRLDLPATTTFYHAMEDPIVLSDQLDDLPGSADTRHLQGTGHFDFIYPGTAACTAVLNHIEDLS